MKHLPLLFAALLLTGCATRIVEQPITNQHGGADADAQMEFWHALYESKVTSYDDAFHGLLLFIDSENVPADYPAKVEALQSRGLLPAGFDRPANEAAQRGDVAVVVINLLKPKRGLLATVLPHSPRYASRELQYVGLFPQGSPWQSLTGGQFVSIIGRLEDYARTNPTDLPAKELPDGEVPAEGDVPKEGEVVPNAPAQPEAEEGEKPVAMRK